MLNAEYIKKITAQLPDFDWKPHFCLAELQSYDETVLEKIKDKTLYEQVADINLFTLDGPNIYGGLNVWIYKSKKNGHYIYWEYSWGD